MPPKITSQQHNPVWFTTKQPKYTKGPFSNRDPTPKYSEIHIQTLQSSLSKLVKGFKIHKSYIDISLIWASFDWVSELPSFQPIVSPFKQLKLHIQISFIVKLQLSSVLLPKFESDLQYITLVFWLEWFSQSIAPIRGLNIYVTSP